MLSKINPERITCERVDFKSYLTDSIILSYPDLYSIVLVEHYGSLTINFEEHKLKGHYLIFLCPEEVLAVRGYVKCKVITIPGIHEIIERDNFISAFGNLKKCFQLKSMSLLNIIVLFNELQQLIIKNDNTRNLKNKLSQILRVRTSVEGDSKQEGLMFQYNFISLVHHHYKMHHEMSFYSEKLATTSKHITERFHLAGLMPPHKFIKKRILIEVKRQLAHTNKMIRAICFDTGFNDPAYFARFFKKNEGITCTQFRALHKPA